MLIRKKINDIFLLGIEVRKLENLFYEVIVYILYI